MSTVFNPAKNFILGFHGLAPSSDFLKLINDNQPAGFIFLGENYENPDQFSLTVNTL